VSDCFHCGEPVPAGVDLELVVGGERKPMCCPGCRAVAEMIEAQGLARFYDFRSAPSRKPRTRDATVDEWLVCDRPDVAARIVSPVGPELSELTCKVGGLTCAACAWLIERGIRGLEGVDDVSVNPVSGETRIRFAPARARPSQILETLTNLGFEPRPAFGAAARHAQSAAGHAELKRLAVAGLGLGQVMTLSAALYLGAFKHMSVTFVSFFALASMLIATPVILYSGAPIFRGAWRSLKHKRFGMDVPVSLAIGTALGASLVNALRGTGPVYFDSATMFVFFLTLGRFLESRARHKAVGLFDALADLKPLSARRRRGETVEHVGTVELAVGDRLLVAPGEAVPADGRLVSELASFDEALLSGESSARVRERGETVLGGSLNLGTAPIEIEVERVGAEGYLERIGALLGRAMADRPDFLRVADRWAARFVAVLLAVTAIVGAAWLALAPERALEVVLAMLVVTCPCALSLAAPTAFAVALGRLARFGLLLRSARVIERLGHVDVWLFDKTGTLTAGRITAAGVETFGSLDAAECLSVAAALEAGIDHPISQALKAEESSSAAERVVYRTGMGVTGFVAGRRYRLGSARHAGTEPDTVGTRQSIYLADDEQLLARIDLTDAVRAHARSAIRTLAATGAEVALVSGDAPGAVTVTARSLDIPTYHAEQRPEDKLALLADYQRAGHVVAAVGDGINDAPLLARADVSVAFVAGSELAQASADIIFTGTDLRLLAALPYWAATTRRIVRQNLYWAVAYNLTAVPLAALGLLAPWMAAAGMSLSSLVVVSNALRLGRLLAPRGSTVRSPPLHRLEQQEAA
jgi:P-type Cu2+ transporter